MSLTLDDYAGIPTGDMPGDSVQIGQSHLDKAERVYPRLLAANGHHRAIVAVHGGSGVGKSEIGSVLGEMLRRDGIGAYVMSGDNYPRRIPAANDAERLRRFRTGGVQGLAASGVFGDEVRAQLAALQAADQDADPGQVAAHPWLQHYQDAGRGALAAYLGTTNEIDFDEGNGIFAATRSTASSPPSKTAPRPSR